MNMQPICPAFIEISRFRNYARFSLLRNGLSPSLIPNRAPHRRRALILIFLGGYFPVLHVLFISFKTANGARERTARSALLQRIAPHFH